ncbi:MAG: hypothetical protein DRH93_03115 [Deltaproteobacteria bacterium]|nr:MAG: hypothetical protein DRH93_03115 [Deltaproteobacteria bacterium]
MLWATTGKTVAELIENRSNPDVLNMGLTSWRGSIVRKQDVSIAKNYLNADGIKDLNEIVTMYLDYAKRQARQRRTVSMELILLTNKYQSLEDAKEILGDAANISSLFIEFQQYLYLQKVA